jgi:hypothetical protein
MLVTMCKKEMLIELLVLWVIYLEGVREVFEGLYIPPRASPRCLKHPLTFGE